MKRITIDAGKNSLNPEKDLDKLKKHLYNFIFELKKMPEYELKWSIQDAKIDYNIKKIINMLNLGG